MARRVVLIDGTASSRILLSSKLRAGGYIVDQAATEAEGLERISEHLPDAVIISDDSVPAPTQVAAILKSPPRPLSVPVLVIAPSGADTDEPSLADAVIPCPVNETLLMARLRSVIRVRDMEEELLLRSKTYRELGLAEAQAEFAVQGKVLCASAPDQRPFHLSASSANTWNWVRIDTVIATLDGCGPQDLVVLDLRGDLAAASTLSLLAELRCRTETRHACIFVVLPNGSEDLAAMALDLGASDIALGLPPPAAMTARVERLIKQKRRFERLRRQASDGMQLAITDPLTGLHNRRYAMSHLEAMCQRSGRSRRPFALMILDLDRFKSDNDTYGHAAGDAVLKAVAHRLQDNLRSVDLLARFGGEEFLVAMPETSETEAHTVAERLCRKVAETCIVLDDGRQIAVTLSIGLAVRGAAGADSATDVVKKALQDADQALYGSKAQGRNTVTISFRAA
ncbi:MAG: diguanylate cyclase [Pseudomonadota bacterium]